jgi:pilus assembly protein CpaB
VVVLATGKLTGNTNINLVPENERHFGTITFLVLPEEAEILSLATELGALTLTLRNPEDIDEQEARGHTTIHTLLSGERASILRRVRNDAFIEIYHGTRLTHSNGKAEVSTDR